MGYSLVDKLYANVTYTETVEVLGRKMEFKPLDPQAEVEVSRTSGDAANMMEILQRRRLPTLARGITLIDGVPWSDYDEIKQRLRSNPGMTLAQAVEQELSDPGRYSDDVVQIMFEAYQGFKLRHRENLEALKKSSTPLSPVTAG